MESRRWPQSGQVQESPYLSPETGPQLAPKASDFVTRAADQARAVTCPAYPWVMAMTVRTLTDEQRRQVLEAYLVKPRSVLSPSERAEAVRRAMSGLRLPRPVTKADYRA